MVLNARRADEDHELFAMTRTYLSLILPSVVSLTHVSHQYTTLDAHGVSEDAHAGAPVRTAGLVLVRVHILVFKRISRKRPAGRRTGYITQLDVCAASLWKSAVAPLAFKLV
jgi:hypothetical protein